jgi:hypothetical protein
MSKPASPVTGLDELQAELDASFEIELARSAALRGLVVHSGRGVVYHAWKLGWIVGQQKGLAKAQEVFSK